MSQFTAVDLSRLPAPTVVEELDFETIFGAMLGQLRALDPQFTALTEADPAFKLLQVAAYRELLLRQRVNDAARAVMLAYASGSDLDQLGALLGVARLQLDPGNPVLGTPPVMESDDAFRRRIQLAPEGYSVAGPSGAYVYHALSADPEVEDAAATSPAPGIVDIHVLSRSPSGIPSPAALDAVQQALSADDVRPLTDHVRVFAADVIEYTVEAELVLFDGADTTSILHASQQAVEAYVAERRKIGQGVARSGLFAALHGPGVRTVELIQPTADVAALSHQAAICTGVSVRLA